MTFYAGFDSLPFPGAAMMTWLTANTNLEWCGYYLAPAPNRPSSQWMGQYQSIKDNWGMLPIYVGQQDPRTAHGDYVPSSVLTAEQGAKDGANACDLASGEGFPTGSFVYLDWEYGGLLDAEGSSDYIKAWVSSVAADGRAQPGVYCSHNSAQAIVDVIDTINPTPNVRLWCWKVPDANPHQFQGDLANIPAIDPKGCGFAGAQAWQREQQAIVTFPEGAPITTLTMDFSTSGLANPSTPSISLARTFNNIELQAIFDRKQTRRTGAPLEEAWQRTRWYWILSYHNIDLAIVAAAYLAAVLVAIVVVLSIEPAGGLGTTGLQIIFGTAVFGTFIELIRRIYDTAIRRMATVDLFTSEMLSILRVFAAANIIGDFALLYDRLAVEDPGNKEQEAKPLTTTSIPKGFADVARSENYFNMFENNSAELGALDPAVIHDVTAFYTFLKASRDATGAIRLWKETGYDAPSKKEDIVAIVYLCFLMTVHGQRALNSLVNSAENRKIIDDILSGVLLQCFSFLDYTLPPDDFRRSRLDQRRKACKHLRGIYGYRW
ncbi:glycoside hydrolase domain-containing protein [Bradyrhizobium sp. USDA 4451]